MPPDVAKYVQKINLEKKLTKIVRMGKIFTIHEMIYMVYEINV
jgi:hypothetical protein